MRGIVKMSSSQYLTRQELRPQRVSAIAMLMVLLMGTAFGIAFSTGLVRAATTGSLAITLTGFPSSQSAEVYITGPNGYSALPSIAGGTTDTITGLTPGSYTVQPGLTAGYQPTQGSYTESVSAGSTTSVTILYVSTGPTTGSLSITLTGFPSSQSAEVYITGPNSYSALPSIAGGATDTITGLTPGTYTVQPGLTAGYQPTQGSYTESVSAGSTTSVSIPYVPTGPTTGTLAVTLTGFPSSQSAEVYITGPNGYSALPYISGGATDTLTGLTPGSYTVQPGLTAGYQPAQGTYYESVSAGATTSVTIPYVASTVTQPIVASFNSVNGGSSQTVTISGCNPTPSSFSGDGFSHSITMSPSCFFTLSLPSGYQFTGGAGTTTCSSGTCSTYSTSYEATPPSTVNQPIAASFNSVNGGSQQTITISGCSPSPPSFPGDGSSNSITMTPSCTFTLSLQSGYQFIGGAGTMTCSSGTCSSFTTSYEATPQVTQIVFTESGLTLGTVWSVTLVSNTVPSVTLLNSASAPNSITLHVPTGVYQDIYVLYASGDYSISYTLASGNPNDFFQNVAGPFTHPAIIPNGSSYQIDVAFTPTLFTIQFTTDGLPSGFGWTTKLASAPASSSPSILAPSCSSLFGYCNFHVTDGKYDFGVVISGTTSSSSSTTSKYLTLLATGTVEVNGNDVIITLSFSWTQFSSGGITSCTYLSGNPNNCQLSAAVSFSQQAPYDGASWQEKMDFISATEDLLCFLSASPDCSTPPAGPGPIEITVDAPVNLLIKDPNGNIVGFGANGTAVNEIRSAILFGPCSNSTDLLETIYIPNPIAGQYQITAFPACSRPNGSPYTIHVQNSKGTQSQGETAYQGRPSQNFSISLNSSGTISVPTSTPLDPIGMLITVSAAVIVATVRRKPNRLKEPA